MAIHDNEKQLFFAAQSESQDVPDNFLGTTEQTYQESSYVASTVNKPWNNDDLFRKTGDYSIYEKMANDDQISVCLDLLCDLIVGTGWEIMSEEDEGQEIADEVYKILEQGMSVSFDEYVEEYVHNASKYGFAIAEKVFEIQPDGAIGLKSLKTRHPGSWLLYTDEFGNMEKYQQHGPNGDVDIDPKALMHFVNRRLHDNPYGTSDLRKAYDAWFIKQHLIRYYAIFLEKAAGPMPHAQFDKNLPTEKINDLFNMVKNFATKTAIVTPKDVELTFLESKNNGDVYIKGINLFNMLIGRALFIPDLTGLQGSETSGGSYNLGTTQIDLFFKHISKRRRILERMINKQIIEPMVIWNHGEQEYYPKFQFKAITEDHSTEYAKIFIEAIKGKIYKPNEQEINHLRSLIKFPEGDVELVEEPQPVSVGPDGLPIPGQEQEKEVPAPGKEGEEQEPKEEVKSFKKKIYDHTVGTYYKRVDFKLMEQQLDSGVKELIGELEPLVKESIADLYEQVKRKNILGNNPKPEKLDTLKLKNLAKMNQVIKKKLKAHYEQSKVEAKRELTPSKKEFAQPIPSEKFLKFLEEDIYQYLGDYSYGIIKSTRVRIMNAIRDGLPIESVLTPEDKELMALSEVGLERYSRTKFTEVMNKARLEEFEGSNVVAAYQYSAVMDDRTSDICAELHEKVFEKGTEVVPPLHFNCRSTLIPITIFEEYKADNSAKLDKMIDEELEKTGFSRYTQEEKPKITDHGVDFKLVSSGNMDTTTYSLKGKPFEQIIITYENDNRKNIVSKEHKRLDNGEKI